MPSKSSPPPYIGPDLLAYLDQLYPERCPELSWPDREIWLRAGQRAVVRHLIGLAEEQETQRVHVQPEGSPGSPAAAPSKPQ